MTQSHTKAIREVYIFQLFVNDAHCLWESEGFFFFSLFQTPLVLIFGPAICDISRIDDVVITPKGLRKGWFHSQEVSV
ncbi:hypothetical protein RchiOBHm_Chr2g0107501 [Rosa chinensis]|uniref:Uncharacterized protein n=1 Tax=Rosa chinensis TaxID=74649 RepID=A0A2P6RNZ1_ROSCH|nr:hypothetical protein RchiOBHm_Chr2g0107501 [Rosa chinensis]